MLLIFVNTFVQPRFNPRHITAFSMLSSNKIGVVCLLLLILFPEAEVWFERHIWGVKFINSTSKMSFCQTVCF